MLKKFNVKRDQRNSYENDISKGYVIGHSVLNVSGLNNDVDIGAEDLWPAGGTLSYLSSEELMDYVSDNAADTSAGTGARSLFVSGINDAGEEVTESIVLNGTTSVAGTVPMTVINFMFIASSGTGLTNAGIITATATVGTQCAMYAGVGISQHGFYRVPASKNVIIKSIELNGSKSSGGQSPLIEFRLYARFSPTSPWIVILEREIDTAVVMNVFLPQVLSGVLSAGADIRFSATTDENNTFAYARLIGVLYDV